MHYWPNNARQIALPAQAGRAIVLVALLLMTLLASASQAHAQPSFAAPVFSWLVSRASTAKTSGAYSDASPAADAGAVAGGVAASVYCGPAAPGCLAAVGLIRVEVSIDAASWASAARDHSCMAIYDLRDFAPLAASSTPVPYTLIKYNGPACSDTQDQLLTDDLLARMYPHH